MPAGLMCARLTEPHRNPAFPGFAPRDTVTAVEQHKVEDELGAGSVFVLRAIVHPAAPENSGCVRARILSGLNLIQVVKKSLELHACAVLLTG